jgi:hypothetical protein
LFQLGISGFARRLRQNLKRHSREGGNPVLLFRCHPERSEGSDYTPFETARRALARMPDPPDTCTKFFAFGDLLLGNSAKK